MRYSNKAGLPPGSLIHIGNRRTETISISVFSYDEAGFTEFATLDIEGLKELLHEHKVMWVNIDGLHEVEFIRQFGEVFDLHHLHLEDILNTGHMPKADEYDHYGFLTVRMMEIDDETCEISSEQVSIILGKNFVLSFQEAPGDVFDPIRDRIRNVRGRVRQRGADYLMYVLIDSVVDRYFRIIEKLGERIELLEDEVIDNPKGDFVEKLQYRKKQLMQLRRSVYPLRDALSTLTKSDNELISGKTARYLKDVQDHVLQIIDTIESQRDSVNSLMDVYLTGLSNKMNSVMKVLTIIATIFIPLTFIVGVYGMNFRYMPELEWRYGYPAVWALMIGAFGLMIYYFRKQDWL